MIPLRVQFLRASVFILHLRNAEGFSIGLNWLGEDTAIWNEACEKNSYFLRGV